MSVVVVLLLLVVVVAVVGVVLAVTLGTAARRTRRSGPVIDPFTVQEPWRRAVQDAVQARNRFRAALGRMKAGPLRDQMAEVGARLEEAVQACWDVARQGHAIDDAYRTLDPNGLRSRQRMLEAGGPGADDVALASVRSQLAAAERLRTKSAETQQRLRILTTRLDEAAAHALELSVTAGSAVDAHQISSTLQDVTGELGSLRLALEETAGG